MLGKRPKYRSDFLLILFIPLMFFGSCKLFTINKSEVKSVKNIKAREGRSFLYSNESALQAEWRAEMQTMISEKLFVEFLADSIIDYASTFMGVPYKHGGNGPKKFDCSGFTYYVFRHFGYSLKRSVEGQLNDGWKKIDDTDELRRGDLVFYGGRKNPKKLGHVAIVVDNYPDDGYFTFIHATVKRGVIISKSNEKYYRIRYMAACRILPE